MEYTDFLEQIRLTVQKKLGEEAKVSVTRLPMNNRSYADSITILRKGENITPAIYMDSYYEEYKDGAPLEALADSILRVYLHYRTNGTLDLSFYADYENVRQLVCCRLVNYEKNRELLKKIPHRRFLDLAVVYYCQVNHEEIGPGNILIYNAQLTLWDVDEAELYDAAVSNTIRKHPYEMVAIGDMLEELLGISAPDEEELAPIYVLTNTEKYYGAVSMIFGSILEAIGEAFECDFFVLPSSIHECMVIPDTGDWTASELHRMVHEVNCEQVKPEEILGESVYRYDRRQRKLEIVWGEE